MPTREIGGGNDSVWGNDRFWVQTTIRKGNR